MAEYIRTVCEQCGDIELSADAARLDIPVRERAGAVVSFDCPRCGYAQRQEISERATLLLMRTGVGVAVDIPDKDAGALRRDRSR